MSRRHDSSDAPRIVYYPLAPTTVRMLTPEQAARRDAEYAAQYRQWAERYRAQNAADQRNRRRALGAIGAAVLVLAALLGLGGWWLSGALGQLATGTLPQVDNLAVKVFAFLGLGGGGGLITVRVCLHKH